MFCPLFACADSSPSPAPEGVSVAVAPLTLPGITNACYRLTVTNQAAQTVWQQPGVCADQYGDGVGAISYVGPCDADLVNGAPQTNTVTLELEDLFDANGQVDRTQYVNPCGHLTNGNNDGFAPCELSFECLENEDVLVEFNITVMRDANQGFFDIAVNFEDIFCSAKLDSCYAPDKPITLLHGEEGREHTAVAAVACTSGAGEQTQIMLAQPYVVCNVEGGGGEIVFELDLAAASGGNASVIVSTEAGDYELDYAVYFGNEQLDCGDNEEGPISCGKVYYNIAINIEALAGQGPAGYAIESCQLYYGATAIEAEDAVFDSAGFLAGTRSVYPWLSFNGVEGVDIVSGGAPGCFSHGLNREESLVKTSYITGSEFDDEDPDYQVGYWTSGSAATPYVTGNRAAGTRENVIVSGGSLERWLCTGGSTRGEGCECCSTTGQGCYSGTVGYTWWGRRYCEVYLD